MANLHAGAVELFVGKRASLRYSTIENWSKNMYNLNTTRAVVQEGGAVEWISGSFGSHVGYLYLASILPAAAASSFTGITFAGAGQNLDTGCKVVLAAPDTSATVETKSISKGGGASTFRSSIVATENARGAAASVSCQSLMLDDISRSDTIPAMDIRCKHVDIGHEATIGRIGDDKVFYLMSRGVSEEEARTMIVNGFADPVNRRNCRWSTPWEMKQPDQARNGRGHRIMGTLTIEHANAMPAPTWHRLHVNDVDIELPDDLGSRPPVEVSRRRAVGRGWGVRSRALQPFRGRRLRPPLSGSRWRSWINPSHARGDHELLPGRTRKRPDIGCTPGRRPSNPRCSHGRRGGCASD